MVNCEVETVAVAAKVFAAPAKVTPILPEIYKFGFGKIDYDELRTGQWCLGGKADSCGFASSSWNAVCRCNIEGNVTDDATDLRGIRSTHDISCGPDIEI